MVQSELSDGTDEPLQKPQMAEYLVQNAAGTVSTLERMPRLLIENVFLKSAYDPMAIGSGGARRVL